MLSETQIERYSRQIILPEVGGRGQERLLRARVCLAGSGPAAVEAATLLARAGVGALDIIGAAAPDAPAPDCRVASHPGPSRVPTPEVSVDLADDPTLSLTLGRRAAELGRPFVLGRLGQVEVAVATLVGRPCHACLAPNALPVPPPAGGPLTAAAALALGALAAAEALAALLAPPRGRLQRIDLGSGSVYAGALPPTIGCAVCGGMA
jgi:hypothetical protein